MPRIFFGGYDDPDNYINRTFQIESGGNPYAVTGSNRGLSQFGPEEESRYGINDTNRYTPGAQARGLQLEARDNTAKLERVLGRTPEPWEYYLAHQQGGAGGPALLSALAADPNQPAWEAIRPYYRSDRIAKQAITGNVYDNLKGVSADNISVADFTNYWRDKFNSGRSNVTASGAGGSGGSDTLQGGTGSEERNPMDTSTLMQLLGGQRQRPQGLMGALSDPETMSYLAMIGKGFQPSSSLDPQAMMQLAQRRQSDDLQRLIQLQQLGISQGNLDVARGNLGVHQQNLTREQERDAAARADIELKRRNNSEALKELPSLNPGAPPASSPIPPTPGVPAVGPRSSLEGGDGGDIPPTAAYAQGVTVQAPEVATQSQSARDQQLRARDREITRRLGLEGLDPNVRNLLEKEQQRTQDLIGVPEGILDPKTYKKTKTEQTITEEAQAPGKASTAFGVLGDLEKAYKLIEPNMHTTGAMAGLQYLPIATYSRDLANKLNTIKGNITTEALQAMRNANPTGAGLGNISNFEDKLLGSLKGAFDQFGSRDQLRDDMNRLRNYTHAIATGYKATPQNADSILKGASYLAEARQAIAQGKSVEAVAKRLQEMGIDPRGL
jgi:hypothetical protein